MKKLAALCATALALASPGIAQAASPDGDHVFTGTVEIRKNMPVWVPCPMTAVVNVTATVPTLKSVVVTGGGGGCTGITFSGLPSAPLDTTGLPLVIVQNVRIDIPVFVPDACEGDLQFVWGGNTANPRTIAFVDGVSSLPDALPNNPGASLNPCRFSGVLTQNSGALNL